MEKFSLLTSVGNENEADIIKALLDSNSIPVVVKHKGNGSYLNIYMGTSYEGIDILVPEEYLFEAQGLIGEKGQVILQETLPEDKEFNNRKKPQDKKRNLMLIFMVLVSISIVISLIVKTNQ